MVESSVITEAYLIISYRKRFRSQIEALECSFYAYKLIDLDA